MKDETLNDLAVDTLTVLNDTKKRAHNYNDFGSVLGVRDEMDRIEKDLEDALRAARRRLRYLRHRIDKWEDGDREVQLLQEPNKP